MTTENGLPLYSKATLIKSSALALLFALITYVIIILPAEYNEDPTGIGSMLGLTVLSQPNATPTIVDKNAAAGTGGYQSNVVEIAVPAKGGVEYKFKLEKYGNLTYEWITSGGDLYFDFHGEPAGDTSGYFESFTVGTADEMKGSTTVPFDGTHGWYWENKTDKIIKVQLKTSGNYVILGLK